MGRVCVPEYVLDRIEGSSLNLCSKILRDGSPVGSSLLLGLDRIEGFFLVLWVPSSFTMGSSF